jgi:hypothetical protein
LWHLQNCNTTLLQSHRWGETLQHRTHSTASPVSATFDFLWILCCVCVVGSRLKPPTCHWNTQCMSALSYTVNALIIDANSEEK